MIAAVLSGGIGLGAYQAGAYEVLHADVHLRPQWFSASSVGAVNAALIAGNAPDRVTARLNEFWGGEGALSTSLAEPSFFSRVQSWTSAGGARIFGVPGQFRPRMPAPAREFRSLYDLAPMRERLTALVDFERLNSGPVRVTVATTDIESGDVVLFDTAKGDRIGRDHLLATCGFLPEFAPVEIGGRLLGDGGLSANAPVEPVLEEMMAGTVFVIDVFARDGARPGDVARALARKNDLLFANQTYLRLRLFERQAARRGKDKFPQVFYLSYRAPPEEADSEKPFDYSARALRRRRDAGVRDMAEALALLSKGPRTGIIPIRRVAGDQNGDRFEGTSKRAVG
ncbi:MAG: patatin-like phospholipase family protein [Hyphomicrobiales bacterium]